MSMAAAALAVIASAGARAEPVVPAQPTPNATVATEPASKPTGPSIAPAREFVPRGQPVEITRSASAPESGPRLALYRAWPGTKRAAEQAEYVDWPTLDGQPADRADLAALWPGVWSLARVVGGAGSGGGHGVWLVQAGEEAGPLVIEPMVTPARAVATDPRGLGVRFVEPEERVFSGVRVYPLERVVLETSLGRMVVALRPDAAPRTARHFAELVRRGFYNGLTFHRVIGPSEAARPGTAEAEGYLIQGGDPLGDGTGGPGVTLPLEQSTLEHGVGTVSMARLSAPDSAGSQFFITLSRSASRGLDGSYAALGEVVEGLEVLRAIARVPVGPSDRPREPVVITRAWLQPAPASGAPAERRDDSGAAAGAGSAR
jgi:peptidyl-prolyl cis-trans isomerase B (cyclophilin B)